MAWSASNAASAGASRPRSCMTAWSWTCRLRWHAKQAEPWPLGREQAGPPPARQGWRVSRPRFAHDLAVARRPLSARLNDEPLVGRNKRSALHQCLTNCGRKPQRPLPRVRGRDREGAWNDTYRECALAPSPQPSPASGGREQTELAPRSRCDGDLHPQTRAETQRRSRRALSAFTRLFDALWRSPAFAALRPGYVLQASRAGRLRLCRGRPRDRSRLTTTPRDRCGRIHDATDSRVREFCATALPAARP